MLHQILKTMLVSPFNLLLLGGLLYFWQKRLACWLTPLLMVLASLPVTAWLLASGLDCPQPEILPKAPIVVLGGGRLWSQPDHGGEDAPALTTFARLRYGVQLSRQLHEPMIVSGGIVLTEKLSEARLMHRSLRDDFLIPANQVVEEGNSSNTWENARNVAAMLGTGRKVLLVTSALHMRRAELDFRLAGLQPIPAPVAVYRLPPMRVLWFLPQLRAEQVVSEAEMEWLGVGIAYMRWGASALERIWLKASSI